MVSDEDRLYALLPAIYRLRDAEQNLTLRDLLRTIGTQVTVVETDIAAQYDDWFIETCAEWVVPFIGDLIGWQPVAPAAASAAPHGFALAPAYSPRADVANTVAHRRRKGTFAVLAQLARDVAGWPAVTVEFYRALGWTQHLDHRHLHRGRIVAVRDPAALARIDGPFDRQAHIVDIRRINAHRKPGRDNIASVGVFVFRLQSLSVTRTPAFLHEDIAAHCYTFSLLGNDTELFLRPGRPAGGRDTPPELGYPVPIERDMLDAPSGHSRTRVTGASAAIYGEDASLAIWAPNWPTRNAPQPVPAELIMAADLGNWMYRAPRNTILVDPRRGRIVFPPNQRPERVSVSYFYGTPALIGGGEYARPIARPEQAAGYWVHAAGFTGALADRHFRTIADALVQWQTESSAAKPALVGVIELLESGAYAGPVDIELAEGRTLHLRAANRVRPVLRLLDRQMDESDALRVRGKAGSRLFLDGLVITGRGLAIVGPDRESTDRGPDLCDVTIRHCTLVPGWGLTCDCDPRRPSEPSIVCEGTSATVDIGWSIVGAIQVVADEFRTDPIRILLADSIVDATSLTNPAVSSSTGSIAFAELTVRRVTILGEVLVHAVTLGENTIFASVVTAARRQVGCLRYCFAPNGSRTPRRHRCQPDIALQAIDPLLTAAARLTAQNEVLLRVLPEFESTRYGTARYCRLVMGCGDEIRGGADDGSEMGVYHDLFETQRAASLQSRLDEHTPAGMQAGILFTT